MWQAFNHREHALAAIQEAVRSAQQHEDNVCLAYALLWMYRAQAESGGGASHGGAVGSLLDDDDGSAAEPPPMVAASAQKQQALLQRCLARAHELGLPELAALASQSLALRAIDASAQASGGSEPVTTSATPEPSVAAARPPCLPQVPLSLPGALPSMPAAQPPPLHVWNALRCGAEATGAWAGSNLLLRPPSWARRRAKRRARCPERGGAREEESALTTADRHGWSFIDGASVPAPLLAGGSVQLVRACAWEHFGDAKLASLAASLQLR